VETVTRVDFGRLSKAQRTPQGGLRIPATFTRSGIFEYARADGSTSREYRPPDEVFHADAISSLEDAPVTKLHPSGLVEPGNYRALSVGHVRPGVKRDGEYIAGEVVIQDAEAVAAVERGELAEISLGYKVHLDATPGVTPEGERYDAVQRRIVHNHAALGPVGWGRAGRDVGLRMDSTDAVQVRADDGAQATPEPAGPVQPRSIAMSSTIRVDGVDVKLEDHAKQVVEKALKERDDALAQARKDASEAKAKADAADEENGKLKKQLEDAEDDEKTDAKVRAREALRSDARAILGDDAKLDGKPEAEIIAEALGKACPSLKLDDKDPHYLRARFDAAVEAAKSTKRTDSVVGVRGGVMAAQAQGGTPRVDALAARQQMVEHNRNLWKGETPSVES
jgi:uncharacterized protein